MNAHTLLDHRGLPRLCHCMYVETGRFNACDRLDNCSPVHSVGRYLY